MNLVVIAFSFSFFHSMLLVGRQTASISHDVFLSGTLPKHRGPSSLPRAMTERTGSMTSNPRDPEIRTHFLPSSLPAKKRSDRRREMKPPFQEDPSVLFPVLRFVVLDPSLFYRASFTFETEATPTRPLPIGMKRNAQRRAIARSFRLSRRSVPCTMRCSIQTSLLRRDPLP